MNKVILLIRDIISKRFYVLLCSAVIGNDTIPMLICNLIQARIKSVLLGLLKSARDTSDAPFLDMTISGQLFCPCELLCCRHYKSFAV